MKFRVAIATVLFALIAACGQPATYSGPATVVEKTHHEAGISIGMTPCGKTQCAHPVPVPESWEITVEYADQIKTHNTFNVDEDRYASIKQGDTVKIKNDELA